MLRKITTTVRKESIRSIDLDISSEISIEEKYKIKIFQSFSPNYTLKNDIYRIKGIDSN